MNLIPDPLHPAVVHFPIVLILLGTLVSFVAVFWRKGYVPAFAAALLTLGAVGAWVAVETGESDGGLVEDTSPPMEQLIEAHENWAERTLTVATIAAVIALGAAALFRFPRLARGVGVAAALAAGVASWTVYETGHRGGALVYRHGAGVNTSLTATGGGAAVSAQTSRRHEDEDRD
jgi:uncharacterized membrane protein